MKKKVLLGLVVIVGLFTITGCGNSENNGDSGKLKSSNKIITCTDKNASGTTWSVEVNKNGKLLYVTQVSKYKPNSDYEGTCKSFTESVKRENEKGYDFRTSEIVCDDENQTTIVTRKYDVEKNTEKIDIERTMSFIDENGKFDIERWKETKKPDSCIEE